MTSQYETFANKIAQLEGRKRLLEEQLSEAQSKLESDSKHMENATKARAVLQTVAAATQSKLEFHISNLVSMALAAVFPNPYVFQLKYAIRRRQTEADLIFAKNDNETDDILSTGGGGVADIASLALKIASWSLQKNRPTLILDEPTKFLHNPSYEEKASFLLQELSNEVGLQIIMVSDQSKMIAAADQEIHIENVNGEAVAQIV